MFANDYNDTMKDFNNLMYIFLQNSQSTATSVDTTMIQQQPSPHATVQQNQTRLGRLT